MKVRFKKKISLVLVMILLVSTMVPAFAGGDITWENEEEYTASMVVMDEEGTSVADDEDSLLEDTVLISVYKNGGRTLTITWAGTEDLDINEDFEDFQVFDSDRDSYISKTGTADEENNKLVYDLIIQDLSNINIRIKHASAEDYVNLQLAFEPGSLKIVGEEEPAVEEEPTQTYVDGTYYGRAFGYNGSEYIYVTIVIENDVITSIVVTSHGESEKQFDDAYTTIIDRIIQAQGTTEVDTVSGATFTSNGILAAVQVALEKAETGDTSDYTQEIGNEIFDSGDGTKNDPFIIKTEEQFQDFADSVDEGTDFLGYFIQLDNDIEIIDSAWNPVGDEENGFAGTFDGAGNTIDGIKLGSQAEPASLYCAALFAYVKATGTIKDLGVTNVEIYNASAKSCITGSLVADNAGTIDGCWATGTVWGKSDTGNNFTAGLVPYNEGDIINSWTDVTVYAETVGYWAEAGGIAGISTGSIINCYSLGDVTGTTSKDYAAVGGIVGIAGHHGGGLVLNCYAAGDMMSTNATEYLGGLVGYCHEGTIQNSYYNSEASHMVNGEAVSPARGVGGGEEGLVENIFALSADKMKSQSLADRLNNNLSLISTSLLPKDVELYTWVYREGSYVTLSRDAAPEPVGDLLIETEEDLREFAAAVSGGTSFEEQTVILGNNIELTGGEWTPIGETSNTFDGTFEGGGYVISGVKLGSASEDKVLYAAGLFGGIGENGVVRDLGVTDVEIYVTNTTANLTGGLTGYNQGLIERCYVTGKVSGKTTGHNAFVGGFVGYNYGEISNCFSSAEVICGSSSTKFAEGGGFVGINNGGNIVNCYVTGNITVNVSNGASGMAGGFAGYNFGSIGNCYSSGDVRTENGTGNKTEDVGGFVGYNADTIRYGYWNGDASQKINGDEVAEKKGIGLDEGTTANLVKMALSDMVDTDFAKRLNSNLNLVDSSAELVKWGIDAGSNEGKPILDGVGNAGVPSAGNLLTAKINAQNIVYLDDSKSVNYIVSLDGAYRANVFEVAGQFNTDILEYEGYEITLPEDYPTMVLEEIYNDESGAFKLVFAIAQKQTTYSTNGMTPIVKINFSIREGSEVGTSFDGYVEELTVSAINDEGTAVTENASIEVSKASTVISLTKLIYDITHDNVFNKDDLSIIIYRHYMSRTGDADWSAAQLFDMNSDKIIDLVDIITLYTYTK